MNDRGEARALGQAEKGIMRTRFPRLIYVTEETPENGDWWLEVHRHGVRDVEEPGKEIAVYQLVETGRVKILKSLIATGKSKPVRVAKRR